MNQPTTLLAMLTLGALAQADTIVQSGSLAVVSGLQVQPLVVQEFDDMGGARQLQSVTLEAQTSTSGGGMTNTSGIPGQVTVDLIAEYSLNNNLLVATHAMIDVSFQNVGPLLLAFTVFGTDTQTGILDQPTDLANWIGTGDLTLDVLTSFLIVETPAGSLGFGGGGFLNYELTYTFTAVAMPYCSATLNSTGSAATIDVLGGLSIAANGTFLAGDNLPSSQTAVFIYGTTQAQVPFGDGFLCLSLPAGIVRLWPPTTISATGQALRQLDYTQLPSQGQITAGSTWNFQLYYRDPAAAMSGFNLSPGLQLIFAP